MPFLQRCFCVSVCVVSCSCAVVYVTFFMMAACNVDGIKPAVSVDSIGLLALMGWMNAECSRLEWGGRSAAFSCTACVSVFCKSLLINSRLYSKMKI